MESQQSNHPRATPHPHPHLQHILTSHSSQSPQRTVSSTPVSPGLFNPSNPRPTMNFSSHPLSEGTTPAQNSPYLHPLQTHKVRETHVANVDRDFTTGRKIINNYEVIEEIGRGVHGKVKLARNLENGESVAIKIIPRFSKKRRLGRVMANMSPQEKSKREIAILKKIRHPNVVALLEVIDDPELKKIYMVLEHVELGEIVWRKKGLPHICAYERRRIEREMRGEPLTAQEEEYGRMLERRQTIKEMRRAKTALMMQANQEHYWSLEYSPPEDDDTDTQSRLSVRDGIEANFDQTVSSNPPSMKGSRASSRAPSRNQSYRSLSKALGQHAAEPDLPRLPSEEDLETPGPLRSNQASSSALDGTMYGAYDDSAFRGRSPSMADSIISHMSSVDLNPQAHDPFADDYSYVPCFTLDQARITFRDTVLGLEYLHYEGVVHRDIKPANLLWTKDHRVKISDFGVSYFGRPIRDGEPDDTVSESEAADFDDDLELAKTVGTPAFFAPELCYTDLDTDEQPRVSEQIDVWSLGVTLYCIIFARIPFMAEDEFQMFKRIAKEEVYIPRKRLRPVDPTTQPNTTSLYKRVNSAPYRDDDELAYEEISDDLHDLLKKMLIKNPEKRIRLKDVKRHSWVIQGIQNVSAWLEETDPSRRTAGRKIQVDEREMDSAVVPISFLERATSKIRKTLGKFTHPRGERAESSSRRRATSSAASSAGDSPAPPAPAPRDIRRRSLRADSDYFAALRDYSQTTNEHPLSYSVTASPDHSPRDTEPNSATSQQPAPVGGHPSRQTIEVSSDFNGREENAERHTPTAAQQKFARHGHARSITNAFLTLSSGVYETRTVPATPAVDGCSDDAISMLRKGRDMRPTSDDMSRARSADRALVFSSADKRAEAKVSLSTAVAPGSVQLPRRPRPMRSVDLKSNGGESSLLSPNFFSPRAVSAFQQGDPNVHEKQRPALDCDGRPLTAHRIDAIPEGKTPPARVYNLSTPESFARAQETMRRRQRMEYEDQVRHHQLSQSAPESINPAMIPCPPSPDDDAYLHNQAPLSRNGTFGTAISSSSASAEALTTPLTSPSEVTSPLCVANPIPLKDISEQIVDQILAFQSDPSLPALLSGASSVSADLEGEFLGNPGNPNDVKKASLLETTDSLTPPAIAKDSIVGFPLEQQELADSGAIAVHVDENRVKYLTASPAMSPRNVDDDDESDSDEGLTMAKPKKRGSPKDSQAQMGRTVYGARRRDTNASVGSTETAKKVVVHGD
ncbi:Serine/threonine-protein kinase ssp1 [Pleurostoma richardsiae]|uniref:non-specific serine/threonine protein kinase n=1 Tax=Pleurostoma richardsiae TaxID=41990 RepID=A0AA38R8I9_9PEZI|nr:Serine/threonine-protein kinase ssp1 [Pleurostoma richardsiae]